MNSFCDARAVMLLNCAMFYFCTEIFSFFILSQNLIIKGFSDILISFFVIFSFVLCNILLLISYYHMKFSTNSTAFISSVLCSFREIGLAMLYAVHFLSALNGKRRPTPTVFVNHSLQRKHVSKQYSVCCVCIQANS